MNDLICSAESLFHYLFSNDSAQAESILRIGLRPLSDFPESARWLEIQAALPGFFEGLYREIAEPVVQKPYINSGIFLSPIDFRQLPESFLYDKPRFAIPLERIDPEWACVTYELDGSRSRLPYSPDTLQTTRQLWRRELVERWFGVDNHKVFYYVPQVVVYQPGGIPVQPGDFEPAP